MRIRSRTFSAWMKSNFTKSELQDMVRHGVDSGYHGLTYYKDTVALYDKFSGEIWEALYEDAEAFGAPNVLAMLGSFGGAEHVNTDAQFKNLLVWFMAERVAREFVEED